MTRIYSITVLTAEETAGFHGNLGGSGHSRVVGCLSCLHHAEVFSAGLVLRSVECFSEDISTFHSYWKTRLGVRRSRRRRRLWCGCPMTPGLVFFLLAAYWSLSFSSILFHAIPPISMSQTGPAAPFSIILAYVYNTSVNWVCERHIQSTLLKKTQNTSNPRNRLTAMIAEPGSLLGGHGECDAPDWLGYFGRLS